MDKHALKLWRCSHRKIFKIYLVIFQHARKCKSCVKFLVLDMKFSFACGLNFVADLGSNVVKLQNIMNMIVYGFPNY